MRNFLRSFLPWIVAVLISLPLIVRAQTSTPPTGTGYVQIVGNTLAGVPVTVQVDSNGVLATSGGGGGGGGTSSNFGAAFPTAGTAAGFKDSTGVNMTFGKVNASNALVVDGSAVTQPVSGTFFQATQPVSIAATITANAIQSGTWNIGTITTLPAVTQGTAANVAGGGWPMINGEFATDTTGTFTNATQTTSVTTGSSIDGYATIAVSVNGTYGTASAVFEMSDDGGTTWYPTSGVRSDSSTIETGYTTLSNTTRIWFVSVAGMDSFRVRSTAVASGTVNVRFSISAAPVGLQSTSQLAAGTKRDWRTCGESVRQRSPDQRDDGLDEHRSRGRRDAAGHARHDASARPEHHRAGDPNGLRSKYHFGDRGNELDGRNRIQVSGRFR